MKIQVAVVGMALPLTRPSLPLVWYLQGGHWWKHLLGLSQVVKNLSVCLC